MKITFLLFCLSLSFSTYAQKIGVIKNPISDNKQNEAATHFRLTSKSDAIDFIVYGDELNKKKPLFLFCQGSLPVPIFTKYEDGRLWFFGGGIVNFDHSKLSEKYHIVVISKPLTPVVAESKNIDERHCYVRDTTDAQPFWEEYSRHDYLENYIKRNSKVLKYLRKQKWVDKSKAVVYGHSQGSTVALHLSLKNKFITHLGLSGFNPFGRIDQYIREARKDAESEKITWEEADKKIKSNYEFCKTFNNPDSLKAKAHLIPWQSFSRDYVNDMLKLDIPIYLVYGTADIVADLCDLIPLYFIREHKENLTIKRYLELEHNYFELTEDGRLDDNKPHWTQVMEGFEKWVDENSSK